MKVAALALLGACSWVYDAQYDTRASQLEQSRQLFLPGSKLVQFMTASDHKLFWVDVQMPQNTQILHSFDPGTGKTIDYTFPQGGTISATQFHFSDQLVVSCSQPMTAFDASRPNAMVDMAQTGAGECAIAGASVYFITEDSNTQHTVLDRWTPGQGAPVQVDDLSPIVGGSGSIQGMGASGNLLVVVTDLGAMWTIDLGTFKQTWLMNPPVENGSVAFDDNGAAYVGGSSSISTSAGATFTRYADLSSVPIEKGIDDGGYDLNFQHADIQQLDTDNNEFTLTQHHLVYRGKSGIFAYGFDTTKVVDLLFDRKVGDFGFKPLYRSPTIAGSTLFVQDLGDGGTGTSDRSVYSVDLSARLR